MTHVRHPSISAESYNLPIFFPTLDNSPQLGDFVTSDLFQQHALITAIACAMYGLNNTGFSDLKLLASLAVGALLLRMDSSGFSVSTIQDNKVQTAVALALSFIAFVN